MRLLILILTSSTAFAQIDPFANLDTNKDGKLSPSEIPKEARPFIPMVDQNSDGVLTKTEFEKVAAQLITPTPPASPDKSGLKNIDYVGNDNPRQALDIYRPEKSNDQKLPLVVFIHGGGWMSGNKEQGKRIAETITSTGQYAAASINYRLTQHALWPAQLHDCKAAIRFLRGNAERFGIDPDHIAVMGSSAGGHLAALLGTTARNKQLEGSLGAYETQPSDVQCVVNLFGPTNFETFFGKDVDIAKLGKESMVVRLLGKTEEEIRKNMRLASPVHWITKDDAPFFTAHGTRDGLVPFTQAEELDQALEVAGVESHLIAMTGAAHGFASNELNLRIRTFLDQHLRGIPGKISSEPIKIR